MHTLVDTRFDPLLSLCCCRLAVLRHPLPRSPYTTRRLHFWALREAGLGPDNHRPFFDWYKKFIGHFIRIYERSAPMYVDESAAWSANPTNIERYLKAGRRFDDIIIPRPGYE